MDANATPERSGAGLDGPEGVIVERREDEPDEVDLTEAALRSEATLRFEATIWLRDLAAAGDLDDLRL